jgi:hypothetical protein
MTFTDGHPFGVILEAGPGRGFVTAKLLDADGNIIDTRTWTGAGYARSSEVSSDDNRLCRWRDP